MVLKMTQFLWLSVHQTLWQCAILNLLLCNTCLRHWLRQYLYSDMDSVYNCKHTTDKICILVIFRGAVHRTKFNRFRCCCLMCKHVFRFSSKQLRRTSNVWWLVVSHNSKKRRAQLKDNGQLQNVLAVRDENKFLDRNTNAGIYCPLICRVLRNWTA